MHVVSLGILLETIKMFDYPVFEFLFAGIILGVFDFRTYFPTQMFVGGTIFTLRITNPAKESARTNRFEIRTPPKINPQSRNLNTG